MDIIPPIKYMKFSISSGILIPNIKMNPPRIIKVVINVIILLRIMKDINDGGIDILFGTCI